MRRCCIGITVSRYGTEKDVGPMGPGGPPLDPQQDHTAHGNGCPPLFVAVHGRGGEPGLLDPVRPDLDKHEVRRLPLAIET